MPIQIKPLPVLTVKHIERFWKYVDKSPGQGPNGECWGWKGTLNHRGYGQLCLTVSKWTTRQLLTHRLSYAIANGYDPDGLLILHSCDYRRCVNPSHLFKGTAKDNTQDMISKGRVATGMDVGGAKLSDKDVKEIRMLISDGMMQREIADKFSVCRQTITLIKQGRIHGYVPL